MKMKIPCSIIAGLAPCVDDGGHRKYRLDGMHIEEGGASPYAIVSEGHYLIVASWTDESGPTAPSAVTLDAADLTDASARARRHGNTIVELGSHTVAKLDGEYVPWREYIPEKQLSVSVFVDAKLLARVVTAVRKSLKHPNCRKHPIELAIPVDEDGKPEGDKPIGVSGRRPDGRKAMGILLPLSERDVCGAPPPEARGWNQRDDENEADPTGGT